MQMRFIYVDKAQKRPQESYEISVGVIACLKVLMDFLKLILSILKIYFCAFLAATLVAS